MVYKVTVTAAALHDAEEYVVFIREQSNDDQAAVNWWNGLLDAIDSLESLPARCPRIAEQKHFVADTRELLYASHRIIFKIRNESVTVLRIYHGARRGLNKAQKKKRPNRPDAS